MGKKKVAEEDLVVPPQDTRICGTICICQMTLVLSSVALVYLTVAIYMPSTRAFKSGIDPTPVMCTTTRALNKDNCEWGSCGEWCLSKTSGACIQIYVNLRSNGSNLIFQNCTNSANKTCYGIDQDRADKARCINDECKNLTGTFNCTAGQCLNITDAFECIFHNSDAPVKCSGRRGKINCMDISGLYSCSRGTCRKIRTPYNCDRRCGCVNTLMDECKEFLKDFGRDGSDHNARARFPCFYSPGKKDIVVARFDLEVTYRQFVFASVVPSVLFVVSCSILLMCQKTVYVGDDAKMRFKGCVDTETILNKNNVGAPTNGDMGGGGGDEVMAL
ncbi:GL12732 [Drosophila persimilis]|uniref:GL12732 n=1 Tax=Drosophila persimilis TaxID=7234 RepID=B4H7W2_DROPE|nr:GL12732 [Drosophila persimilis]